MTTGGGERALAEAAKQSRTVSMRQSGIAAALRRRDDAGRGAARHQRRRLQRSPSAAPVPPRGRAGHGLLPLVRRRRSAPTAATPAPASSTRRGRTARTARPRRPDARYRSEQAASCRCGRRRSSGCAAASGYGSTIVCAGRARPRDRYRRRRPVGLLQRADRRRDRWRRPACRRPRRRCRPRRPAGEIPRVVGEDRAPRLGRRLGEPASDSSPARHACGARQLADQPRPLELGLPYAARWRG